MTRSLIEIAYEYVSKQKKPVGFKKIWEYVVKEAELPPELAARRVGQFYTNMMLDGRFVTLGENEWDLRERQTFDKVHIDMKDVYSDVETSDDDNEEGEEEKEYNQAFEEPKSATNEEETSEAESSEEDADKSSDAEVNY